MGAPASARDDGTPPVTSLDELPRGQDVSDTVIELAGWVVASGDSQGYPFAIMDKAAAQILVFGGDGRLRGAAPGLFGSAVGDHTAPGIAGLALREIPGRDRTTPAGRFVGGYGPSIDAGRVLWVDYESAVSIHPTATGVPEEKRPERLASCGLPYLESELEIVDEAGQSVAQGEVGEIVVGGPDIFAGYWRAPELTAEVLKNGRYHTGDLARVDEEGYVYIVDRKKDMVISGGFNVYPSEVEAVLYQHEAVADACVFGVPDDKWGEAVAAHIVLKPGRATETQGLDAFCAERLSGFKRPRLFEFVEALPKNPNGKVMRKAVQAPYWSGHDRKVN